MKITPLIASLLLTAGLVCGIVAVSTLHWSNSASGSNSDIDIGLFKACVNRAPVAIFSGCRNLDRSTTTTFLTALGDDNPNSHYDMLNAARILFIVSLGLTGLAAILSFIFMCCLVVRALLALPIIATILAIICNVLCTVFWGVFQSKALSVIPLVNIRLGYSWILSVVYFGLLLGGLLFLFLGCCRSDPMWHRRGYGVGKGTTAAATAAGLGAGTVAGTEMASSSAASTGGGALGNGAYAGGAGGMPGGYSGAAAAGVPIGGGSGMGAGGYGNGQPAMLV